LPLQPQIILRSAFRFRVLQWNLLEGNIMATTLEEVQNLVEKLTLFEQAQLLEYLTPRLTQAIKNGGSELPKKPRVQEFRQLRKQIAAEIAAKDDPNSETMTQEFLRTRR
jgi:hypothetical protein